MKLTLAAIAAFGLLALAGCPKEPAQDAWKNPGEAQSIGGDSAGSTDSGSTDSGSTDAGGG